MHQSSQLSLEKLEYAPWEQGWGWTKKKKKSNWKSLPHIGSVQFKMEPMLLGKPVTLQPSLYFPTVAFETVPILVWLTMALSHLFKVDHWGLLTDNGPFSSVQGRSLMATDWQWPLLVCSRKITEGYWLTMALSHMFNAEHWELSLSVSLSSRQLIWLHGRKTLTACVHLVHTCLPKIKLRFQEQKSPKSATLYNFQEHIS